MQPEHIGVRDFIIQLAFESGQDNIMAAAYYAEFVDGRSDFDAASILGLLDTAKVPRPANVPRDLQVLESKKKFLNLVIGGGRTAYTLTNPGADFVNERMKQVGLVLNKPTERSDLLKQIAESLVPLLQSITDQSERSYIEEAVSCLSPMNMAPRAAVLLGWQGLVNNLRRKIDQRGQSGYLDFTNQLQIIQPKAKPLTGWNDFEDVKDVHFLDVCEKMNVIKGKSVKLQLEQWLVFRNGVGHPNNVKPGIYKIKAFFEDIIQYALAVP